MLPDPQGIPLGDLLVCESTYGNRLHAEVDAEEELAKAINKAHKRNGPLIIPAFAVGRTQNLLYYIAKLERAGKIPVIPVYVDSPMAVDATEIYRKHRHDFDEDAMEILKSGEFPLHTERMSLCRSVDQSKHLNTLKGPRIIISASGMVTGGRILHHMMHNLPHENSTVLFVGYQAVGSRGRIIQSGSNEIKIFGKRVPIRARVYSISGLSAHGDKAELSQWLKSCQGSPALTRVVHGEPESAQYFSNMLKFRFEWDSSPAEYLETVEI
jgi:metallo-beta-lactamase family protein